MKVAIALLVIIGAAAVVLLLTIAANNNDRPGAFVYSTKQVPLGGGRWITCVMVSRPGGEPVGQGCVNPMTVEPR